MSVSQIDRDLLDCLDRASVGHRRLCPRQVLGVRIGLYAGALLGLSVPQQDKRLYAFVETDGCAVDGIIAATGCTVGRRTMRIIDLGKVAATFVDTVSGQAIRIWPHPDARNRALTYAPDAPDRWHAQRDGYCRMPADELFLARDVQLTITLTSVFGRAGVRIDCAICGEEVMNAREVRNGEHALCRSCAGEPYVVATGAPPRLDSSPDRWSQPLESSSQTRMLDDALHTGFVGATS